MHPLGGYGFGDAADDQASAIVLRFTDAAGDGTDAATVDRAAAQTAAEVRQSPAACPGVLTRFDSALAAATGASDPAVLANLTRARGTVAAACGKSLTSSPLFYVALAAAGLGVIFLLTRKH